MANFNAVLKDEIARVARKAVRDDIASMKKALAAHRTEIAALKRRLKELEQQMRQQRKAAPKTAAVAAETAAAVEKFRFRADGLASQRARLGLTAADLGRLLGTSGQTILNWEAGKTKPSETYWPAIAAFRKMNSRDVAQRLAAPGG